MDFLESSVRNVLHLASSYNSKWASQKVLLYTLCTVLQASLSTKLSVISLLKLDSFGLCSSPSALPTKTISVLSLSSRNQNSFKWNKFRLSLPIMNSTLSHFTHFRATYNFNTDELIKTYYLRGKTTEFNILLPNGGPCVTLEYIYGCIKTRSHWFTHRRVWMSLQRCQRTAPLRDWARITLDITRQSILYTDAPWGLILPHSGGFVNSNFFLFSR